MTFFHVQGQAFHLFRCSKNPDIVLQSLELETVWVAMWFRLHVISIKYFLSGCIKWKWNLQTTHNQCKSDVFFWINLSLWHAVLIYFLQGYKIVGCITDKNVWVFQHEKKKKLKKLYRQEHYLQVYKKDIYIRVLNVILSQNQLYKTRIDWYISWLK